MLQVSKIFESWPNTPLWIVFTLLALQHLIPKYLITVLEVLSLFQTDSLRPVHDFFFQKIMYIFQHRWCICICTTGNRTNKHSSLFLRAAPHLAIQGLFPKLLTSASSLMLPTSIGLLLLPNIFIRGSVERREKLTEIKLVEIAPYGSSQEKDHNEGCKP